MGILKSIKNEIAADYGVCFYGLTKFLVSDNIKLLKSPTLTLKSTVGFYIYG